jgi:CubicO group peptidase (beta-lactamase class C family)
MTAADFAKDIALIIEEACETGLIAAGSIAAVAAGETHAFATGMANSVEDVGADEETLFHIGSVTKCMTAELIWKLVLEGRLDVNMPVIAAAPELSHIATLADGRVTLLHLLSHTGGLDGDLIFEAGRGKDVLRHYLSEIRTIDRLHEPGAHFSYANIGYGILGRIAEANAGLPFEDLLARSLRNDHKLSRVAILPLEKIQQRTALHFTGEGEDRRPDYFGPHSNIASGTVLAMSTKDLASWGASRFAEDGKRSAITEAMAQPVVTLAYNHRYAGWGAGVTLFDKPDGKLIGHDGGTAGTTTFLRIAPDQRVAWAFAATGAGGLSAYRKLDPLLRKQFEIQEAPKRVPPGGPAPRDLSPYCGRYSRHGMTFDITGTESGLSISASGSMAPRIVDGIELHPLTAQVFEARLPALDATIWISFHDFDANGKPSLLFVLERMAKREEAP